MAYAHNTPVQFLHGIGWRTARVLHDLDIHTVGQFHQVPEKILTELFGPSIRSVIKQCTQQQSSRQNTKGRSERSVLPQSKSSFFKKIRLATHLLTLL